MEIETVREKRFREIEKKYRYIKLISNLQKSKEKLTLQVSL